MSMPSSIHMINGTSTYMVTVVTGIIALIAPLYSLLPMHALFCNLHLSQLTLST